MAHSHLSIDSLPNEIIINVLNNFPTRSLLPLAVVCRRFYGLVGRVHYTRLVETSRLRDHEVILESFHPSEKLSTPSLHCEFQGMHGLTEAGEVANLGELNNIYARFRPHLDSEKATGQIIQMPSHEISLDSGELFSQLCTITNLVKVGPRRGFFSSFANITDNVIRVWRDWLSEAAKAAARTQQRVDSDSDDRTILWTDSSKTVGIRFRVVEDESAPAPVLLGRDDEPSVSYSLEYQELLIRANWLLLSFESSETQEEMHAGAVYFPGTGAIYQPCYNFLQCAVPSERLFQSIATTFVM
ncbi:uncharacterized protein F4812DRAFT_417934 [Daldinia caldariorum]|uniref:uncharacterized protein n=1 Tax=Daldinia caldariorum TaxID=326644 RepID=UPI0020076BC3|nr:uncharacterized protein F4812DRAFT_417934 [Daldinia caldariorum]KAI1470519.1 hypothetical protein F4812DRAFT_417934 [Daldinia caldariorum]